MFDFISLVLTASSNLRTPKQPSNLLPTNSFNRESHMSAQECNAAVKIQDAWRKYQESKDDDDMHEVHEMGWSMFDGDELDASHYHQNLTDYEQGYEDAVRESFDASSSYQYGYAEGIERGKEEAGRDFERRLQVEINLAKKQAYDDGVIQGSSLADDVIRSLREEINKLKRSNSRLREDLQFATQPTREVYR